jgi:mevalonate kinase
MKFLLSCPAKTFLIGEYGVLDGGQALLVNTRPRFQLKVNSSSENNCHGIHPLSPSGKWLRMQAPYLNKLDIEFEDPWKGSGGLGASSAQFLLSHALLDLIKEKFEFLISEKYINSLLKSYFDTLDDFNISKPSGVDLVSQFIGGICYVEKERGLSHQLSWPFPSKNFLIFKTNKKMNTHEHLSSLIVTDLKEAKELSSKAIYFFKKNEWSAFSESVNTFHKYLNQKKWVSEYTHKWIETIKKWSEVEAVKGCGAMGSDTLVIFSDEALTREIIRKTELLGLTFIGDKTHIDTGLSFSYNSEPSNKKNMFSFTTKEEFSTRGLE